jgi:hypothetical protein
MLTTAALRGGTPVGRVWFLGAGIAMVLSGSLNLLNSAYGAGARGVRSVCIGNNLLMTCFAVAAGVFHGCRPGAVRRCAQPYRRCDRAVVLPASLKPSTIQPTAG